jgi:hypothetical protein
LINTDRWIDAIIDGAVGIYELSAYGKSERYDRFEKIHKRDYRAYGNLDQDSIKPIAFPTRAV